MARRPDSDRAPSSQPSHRAVRCLPASQAHCHSPSSPHVKVPGESPPPVLQLLEHLFDPERKPPGLEAATTIAFSDAAMSAKRLTVLLDHVVKDAGGDRCTAEAVPREARATWPAPEPIMNPTAKIHGTWEVSIRDSSAQLATLSTLNKVRRMQVPDRT